MIEGGYIVILLGFAMLCIGPMRATTKHRASLSIAVIAPALDRAYPIVAPDAAIEVLIIEVAIAAETDPLIRGVRETDQTYRTC